MHPALIAMLGVLAVAIPLFVFFALRTNKQYRSDRVIPGTNIGVKYWDDYGKVAKDINALELQIDGIDDFILAAKAVLEEKYGVRKAKKMLDFDIWLFPLSASRLGLTDPSMNKRRSGLLELYYTWWGMRRKWAVRLRNLERGDVTTTALGHEIAWHFAPRMTAGHWNFDHAVEMKSLETELRIAYQSRIQS
jgi:hypothetical protein